MDGPRLTFGGYAGAVFNVDDKAELLEDGTPTMVPRPLAEAVLDDVSDALERRFDAFTDRLAGR